MKIHDVTPIFVPSMIHNDYDDYDNDDDDTYIQRRIITIFKKMKSD